LTIWTFASVARNLRLNEGLLEWVAHESASELRDLVGIGIEPSALRDIRTTTAAPGPAAQ
jgi:hypothetical protein